MKRFIYPALLVTTVLFGGVLGYSIWKSYPATAAAYFASGKKYYEQQKYPEATIQFLNAVRKDPRHRDARYLLAVSYMNQADFNNALGQLNSLMEYYPDDIAANLQFGRIYFAAAGGNPDMLRVAQERADKILAKEPQNVEALTLSGNALAALKDYPASMERLQKAVIFSGQKAPALVSMGTVQVQQKNFSGAEQSFIKALELEPANKLALISLADFYQFTGKEREAEEAYQKALRTYPGDKDVYLRVIDYYRKTARLADLETILKDLQAKSPEDPQPSLILADVFNQENKRANAKSLLAELKTRFPERIDVATSIALNSVQDQPELARTQIDQILKTEPNNPLGQALLGELQYYSGDYKAAEATFASAPPDTARLPQAQFVLGDIAVKKGRLDEAQSHFQKSLELDASYLPARVALADVFARKGMFPEARIEVKRSLEALPAYTPARVLKASLDTQDKKYAEAEKEFSQLVREEPQNPVVHERMAFYYQARGMMADAEKSFARALDLQPDSQQILEELVQFYISQNQAVRAIERINRVPDNRKGAFHYELIGRAYSSAGKLPESEEAYKKALEKEPGRTSANLYLAMTYIQLRRFDAALNSLDQLLKANPNDAGAYALKGSMYENLGRREDAKLSYSQALKINPNFASAANELAYILAGENRDLGNALSLAQTARRGDPENPAIADTLGWVQYNLGNQALALDQLRFAVSKEPDNPLYQYHLAMIYKATNHTHEAEAALRKAVSSRKDFKEKGLAEAALKQIAKPAGS